MSKNLTRKGLALGAALSLGLGMGAVIPANAADATNVLLAPKTGTTYNSILEAGITLTASLNEFDGDTVTNARNLVWRIENPGGAAITADFNGFGQDDSTNGNANQITIGRATAATAADPLPGDPDNFFQRFVENASSFSAHQGASTGDQIDAVAEATDKFIYVGGFEHTQTSSTLTFNSAAAGESNDLVITTSEDTDAVSLTVQAWLDMDGDGVVDFNEEASDAQTVTLYPVAQVSATTVILPSLSSGATSITADVVLNNDINMEEVGNSEIGVVFSKNGVALPVTETTNGSNNDDIRADSANGAGAAIVPAEYNAGTKTLRAVDNYWVSAEISDAAKGNATNMTVGNYTAIAVYRGSNTSTDKDAFLGTSSATVSLSNGLVTGVVGAQLSGKDSADIVYTDGDTTTPDTFAVRSGAGSSASFTAQVTKADGDDTGALDDTYAAANVEVKAIVKATTLGTGGEITISGATSKITKENVDVFAYGRTDSKGKVTFTLTSKNGKAGDIVEVDVLALNDSGAYVAATAAAEDNEGTFTWTATAPTTFAAVDSAVSGDTVNLGFTVKDNFSQPISATSKGDLMVYFVAVVNGVETPATFSETVAVAAGSATVSVANFVAEGSSAVVVRGYLYRLGYETATSNAVIAAGAGLKTITVYNTPAVSAVQVPASLNSDVTYEDYRVGNSNINVDLLLDSALASTNKVALNGFVADANGAGIAAAQVVVSGAGLLFEEGGVYAEGSITVYTATDGSYSVDVFAHATSSTGVSVTSTTGGVSSTTLLKTYLPATAVNGNNLNLSWDLPAEMVVNTTYAVVVKLTDKWGNPVSTSTTTEALTVTSAGSVQFNGVSAGIDKNFDKNGEVLIYARSIKDIAGPGTISASLNAGSKYAATSAATATTLVVDEIVDNVDGTVWDESEFVNSISTDVNVVETATPMVDTKVNAGSFKGYVALYALGYEGQRMSAKVGNDWVIVPAIPAATNDLFRAVEFVGAGVEISVRLYIDRELVATIPLLTK